MNYRVWLSVLLCTGLLAGCSLPMEGFWVSAQSQQEGDATLGLKPDFSYAYTEQTPNILVNQIGYTPDGEKTAVLQGTNLQSSFYVCMTDGDQVVYQGELRETSSVDTTGTEVNIYLADFSQVKEAGEYYLFQPDLGYSDSFTVATGIYDELEQSVLTLLEEENSNTARLCYQLAGMLMTWELYGEQIAEPERFWRICETKIALLEQAQDAASGGVYGEIPSAGGEEQVSLSATAEYAGVMAMYAYNRREEDGTLANRCQAEAQKACRFLNGSFDNVSFDAGYFALTQLFRLTAYNSYGTAVEQYLAIKDEQKSYTEYDFTLFGDLAYLSSTSGTDLDRSAELMKKVMDEAEEISLSISRNNYYISQQREYDDISGMLKDMSVMALVNYIITNHEYTSLQKNYLEYFLGRNPMAVCFVEGFGSRNAVGEDEEEAEGAREVNEDNVALFYLLLQSTKG